jgi:hypothetical protein
MVDDDLIAEGPDEEREALPTVGELQELVDEMVVALREARTVPLSSNVLVDREQFLANLERLRNDLPDEMRAARWMVREREAFIGRTNEKARDVMDKARARAAELVSQSRIMAEAVEEANALIRQAEAEGSRIRLEAEDEIDRWFVRLDTVFTGVINQLRDARAELYEARQIDEVIDEVPE